MSDDDTFQTLVRLGLSGSQARVYLVMTRVGAAKASAFWKLAKVGRQDMYRVLQELQKLGLIEKVIAAPAEYRAIPLAEGVSILFQRKKNEISSLQTEAMKLVETQHPNAQAATLLDQYQCVMIPEKEATFLRISQMFDRAQRSISVSTTTKRILAAFSAFKFAEALNRGVQVRVIVNTGNKNWFEKLKQPFSTKPNFKLRWMLCKPASAYAIFDEKECGVATSAEAGLLDACLLYLNYPDIVKLLLHHFNMQWNIAKEIQSGKKMSEKQSAK
jgi:sugar-specific transcriptional regulator TrmB